MKKIININLSSRLIPIEDSAYEILRQYLDSLKRYFSQEDGADEIVSDIESRIAEIFQDKLRKGAHCITDADVQEVKTSMGTPEQFDQDAKTGASAETGNQSQPGADPYYYTRPRKRFYRDPEAKILGGVCGGLGAYFNIDPLVFRIIFALLAIGGFGTGIVVYFIIWIATPEAFTAAEKLEMRGERVDVNNIKNAVQEEMNAFKQRVGSMGDDFKNFSQGRGKQFGKEAGNAINGFVIGLRNVLVFLTKGLFMFVAVVVLLSMIAALIGVTFFSEALSVKDIFLAEGAQSFLFWPTIVLLFGVPIVSIVIYLLRKTSGVGQPNKYAGMSLGFLWLLGIVFGIWLLASVFKDFNAEWKNPRETFYIRQPSNGKLILRAQEDMLGTDRHWFFGHDLRVLDDTTIVNDVHIRIEESSNNDFQVFIVKKSRGRNVADAKRYISLLRFVPEQQDSVLIIPNGFALAKNASYRNQEVVLIIQVPVGKSLTVEKEAYRAFNFDRYGWRNEERLDWDDFDEQDRVELRMETDGLDNPRRQRENRRREEREKEIREKVEKEYRERMDTVIVPAKQQNDNRYRYKPSDTSKPTAAITPVDNSDEGNKYSKGAMVAVETASFLFRMYR